MKKEFLKIAGVKTEQEFYDRYPSEEDFFKAHPNALKQLAGGGEAYPQTATMDNFFSYGVPVPPTYYAHGGAYPMAQSEEQFFSPFYGNVPNPYNKAMGGSSEAYPQSMSFPYGNTGRSTHFMMQDGGYAPDEPELPKMGVNGKLLEFVGTVKNTAANKLNSNLRMYGKVKNPEQYEFEQARYGGNLKGYQSKNTPGGINDVSLNDKTGPIYDKNLPQLDYNSDKGTTNNYYYYGPGQQGPSPLGPGCFPGQPCYDQQLPPEYYNDVDYLPGRRRPLSDFNIRGRGIAGNYRSTGWLEDEHGLDKLRQLGLTDITQDNPKWYQFLKRPSKTYHFGNQGQGMGYTPGTVDQQGMPVNTPSAQTPGQQTPGATPDAPGASPKNRDKGPGFFDRLFNREGNITPQLGTMTNVVPDQQVKGDEMISQRSKQMWSPALEPGRLQRMQNRVGRIDKKLDELELFKNWQDKQLGQEVDLMGRKGRQNTRLRERRMGIEDKVNAWRKNLPEEAYGGQQQYQSKNTSGTVKTPSGKEVPLNDHKRGEKTTFKPSMTVEEYLRSKEMSEGLKQQIKDSNNPDTPMAPMQGVVDRQQVGNQPVGATTITPRKLTPMEQLYLDGLKIQSEKAGVTNPQNINQEDINRMFEVAPPYTTGPEGFIYGSSYNAPGSTDFDSNNTEHRAAMMRAIMSGLTDDSYDAILPGKKYGGSRNVGDVVDMTPEELQKFIAMGGQVEFLD